MKTKSASVRVKARALGSSAIVVAALAATPAYAQCSPDPVPANGQVTCTGTDPDGLRVTTINPAITVDAGATVRSGSAAAIDLVPPSSAFSSYASVVVNGTVDGGANVGVRSATSGDPVYSFPSYGLALRVGAGGAITGSTGILIAGQANAAGYVFGSIDNSGSITGSSGIAVQTTSFYSTIRTITNRSTGAIGAIVAPVESLDNAGTIDGGSRSAVSQPFATSPIFSASIVNTGRITANTAAATLAYRNGLSGTNSGSIVNLGSGAAIDAAGISLRNAEGGRIATAGATAIRANGSLSLTNVGTVAGDVVVVQPNASSFGSFVDNSAGTITGSLRLGASDDTLIVGYRDGAIRTGIGGTIDGGAGSDQLRINFYGDATLRATPTLPTGFENLGFYVARDRTVTLENGFALPGNLRIGADTGGTVVNRANLVAAARAITADTGGSNGTGGVFINLGSIRTEFTPRSDFAISWGGTGSIFDNRGTIVSSGRGVGAGYAFGNRFINSGTIVAVDTAVQTAFGGFDNSGTIRSQDGIGVFFENYGFSQAALRNSGRIEGRTTGMMLDGQLINSGQVVGGGTGLGLRSNATLVNTAGASVAGGTRAIGGFDNFGAMQLITISNAGTINGDVVLEGNSSFFRGTDNRYFAERGGVLNGNLVLGANGLLVTELANRGSGLFSGITGSVTGENMRLVYRVRNDATMDVNPGAFAAIGFDLYDDAALTIRSLSAPRTLTFAGNGTVDTAMNLNASFGPFFVLTTPTRATASEEIAQDLAFTSRGTLTLTRSSQNDATAAVVGTTGARFTNAGTIVVVDRSSASERAVAVAGGSGTSNTGSIILNGATGIGNALDVRNDGRIVQAQGGNASTGIAGVSRLVNTGTIEVGGPAIRLDSYAFDGVSIVNSGRIASTGGPAIVDRSFYYNAPVIRNLARGTIAGGNGIAVTLGGGTLVNAGEIAGSVRLGVDSYVRSSAYVAAGGVLRGDLTFGFGDDIFVETDGRTGVTGTIDGGSGSNTYRYRRTSSGSVTLGRRTAVNFANEAVEALGVDTEVAVEADAPFGFLTLFGDGRIVNNANIRSTVRVGGVPFGSPDDVALARLTGFTNQATIGSFVGDVGSFVNKGSIGRSSLNTVAVALSRTGGFALRNDGTIANNGISGAAELNGDGSIVVTNTGTIAGGGLFAASSGESSRAANEPFAIVLDNSGTIVARRPTDSFVTGAVTLLGTEMAGSGQILVNNGGTIDALGSAGVGVFAAFRPTDPAGLVQSIAIRNTGTIRANGGGREVFEVFDRPYLYTLPASGIAVEAPAAVTATITNADTGLIEATGERSTAIASVGATLDIANAGTIRGGAGTVLADTDLTGIGLGTPYLAGAVQGADGDDRIVNSGTIIGSIALGAGNDRIENYGRIDGNVFLGAGDDTFLHRASATQIGTVDAGEGDDGFILDATLGGSVNGDQFVNFERFSQIGSGNVRYAGTFRFNTVDVVGGTVTVAAGQTLASAGDTAITGSDQAETVRNDGTIAGSVSLGGGNDRFVNAGLVDGSVFLGSGDDVFVDQPGSRVTGTIDGGTGNDLYNAVLAGNRSGLGAVRGFERLQLDGFGTLSLVQTDTLEQIALNGTWLNLAQRGNRVGAIVGSDAAEWVAIDGDAGQVALNGGDDRLSLGTAVAAGRYDGGTGNDLLSFTSAAPVVLNGQATGFDTVSVASGALTVNGLLATAGPLWFGDNDLALTIGSGGTLAGTIDLGGGNDSLRLVGAAALVGTVAGGAGNDVATFDLAGNRTLDGGVLSGFETLATAGSGMLTLTGTHGYDRIAAATDLTVAAGGRLAARQVAFGTGDQRFTIAGQFAGSVDGGAGSDGIAVSGGSESAPVAFDAIANVEAFAMTGGYATIAGTGVLGNASLGGGRLVGLAGSTITASQINVGTAAAFGSAGIVNGNLTVAGLLSPGASPGTMTINGNVNLLGSSTSLFELTPTVSDRLVVNGTVTIQNGATLQIATNGYIRPGTSFELVTASGGITGSYTNVSKPASLFGYLLQQGNRIALIGQFRTDATFNPQVARSVDYANRTLLRQGDNSALGAALPLLQTASGAPDPRRFAVLTPEAYASATQIGVDNALTLAQTTRGPAFATTRTDPGAYLFLQSVGQWHRLGADAAQGVNKTQAQGYGYVGGIGYGDSNGMVGMFAGWLDTRQYINTLGTRTQADGIVVGGMARYHAPGGFGLASSIAYNDARARTDRFVPGANGATLGRYDLTTWSADMSVYYAARIGADWALTPRVGATYVRTTRAGVGESGSAAFALNVARDRHLASFVDAGITFGRGDSSDAAFRPFVTLGGRYQFEGTRAEALGGYAGGGLGLLALGAARASMVGTASGGVTYRYGSKLEIYSVATAQTGRDDHQESLIAGARLRF